MTPTFSISIVGRCVVAMTCACPLWSQSTLPFDPEPSGSIAERTIPLSKYAPTPPRSHLPKDAPNIVVIMLDDAGWGLSDTFGGPIHTPTMTRVANSGIRYNRFHNAAMCSPTRAALLTGRNHHRVGNGQIAELSNDWEGYSGVIPKTSATLPKVLGYYGYSTSAFGKWHNTPANETTEVGPYTHWPVGTGIGFDYFYGFLAGESSQYEPAVVENTVRLDPSEGKKNYHFTEDMTDQAVSWIKKQRALSPERPFMMYWAPGGVHGPHHVAKSWADKYRGKFDAGWDQLRVNIFEQQKKLGWIPENSILTERPKDLTAWKDIPEDQKPFQVRLMEVFAGYVEHTDTQAGRLLDTLDELGIRENTLIFYVWSDNGGSSEGQNGTVSELLAQNLIPTQIKDHIRVTEELGGLEVLGSDKTDNMYHAGWAWASSSPYKATKLVAGFFGGTRTPMAISWPRKIQPDSTPRSQFHHVNDITPTIYELLKIEPPQQVDGVTQDPLDGVSLAYTFENAGAEDRKKSQYFEVMGSRAFYKEGWIASVFGPRTPWVPGSTPGLMQWNPDQDVWELYDLTKDFTQAKDVSKEHPEKVQALKDEFLVVAKENKVFPIGGGLYSQFNPDSLPRNPATEFHYTQEVTHVPEGVAPRLGSMDNHLEMELEIEESSQGVLYALGGFSGGLALWIEDGKLTYEFNCFNLQRTQIASDSALPKGKVKLEVISRYPGKELVRPGHISILANGHEIAHGTFPQHASWMFTTNDSFDVGRDSYSPVSNTYAERKPFAFNGTIHRLSVKYIDPN